jgi:hypothetical protein
MKIDINFGVSRISNLVIKHTSKMINANKSSTRHELTEASANLSLSRLEPVHAARTRKTSILGICLYVDTQLNDDEMLIPHSTQAIKNVSKRRIYIEYTKK